MRLGYSRQNEKYRHGDGSYSIWGPSSSGDNVGSIWLTTFVVKAFSQASKYIDIDTRALQKSIDWILEKQSRKSGTIFICLYWTIGIKTQFILDCSNQLYTFIKDNLELY